METTLSTASTRLCSPVFLIASFAIALQRSLPPLQHPAPLQVCRPLHRLSPLARLYNFFTAFWVHLSAGVDCAIHSQPRRHSICSFVRHSSIVLNKMGVALLRRARIVGSSPVSALALMIRISSTMSQVS